MWVNFLAFENFEEGTVITRRLVEMRVPVESIQGVCAHYDKALRQSFVWAAGRRFQVMGDPEQVTQLIDGARSRTYP